jgi:anti-sigma regulatory factor (Ser/Thr protein kinase)
MGGRASRGPRQHRRCVLLPQRAREAREAVWALGLPRVISEAAALVVSELIANAILHGGGPRLVSICYGDGAVRVEVADSSPVAPEIGAVSAMGGRGLRIVSALASKWGSDLSPRGKVVWAEIEPT